MTDVSTPRLKANRGETGAAPMMTPETPCANFTRPSPPPAGDPAKDDMDSSSTIDRMVPRGSSDAAGAVANRGAAASAAEDDENAVRRYFEMHFSSAMAVDWTQRAARTTNVGKDLLKFMPSLFEDVHLTWRDNANAEAHCCEFNERRCDLIRKIIDVAGLLDFVRSAVQASQTRVTVLSRSSLRTSEAPGNVHVFSVESNNGPEVRNATVVFASGGAKSDFLSRHVDHDPNRPWVGLNANDELSKHAQDDDVLIAVGESGSGKTFTSMLLAAARDRDGSAAQLALHVIAKNADAWEEVLTKADVTSTEIRNARAVTLIRDAVVAMTQALVADVSDEAWPAAAAACFSDGRRVVLIVDEAGECPTLVRAVCSARNQLREQVRLALKLPAAFPVTIIVAGTGAEGASRQPGSLPGTHTVITFGSQVASKVWAGLCSKNDKVERFAEMMNREAERGDAACLTARDMVGSNARAAAIFARCVRCLPSDVEVSAYSSFSISSLVRYVTAYTAVKYKSMNGMKDLELPDYTRAFSQAVALTRQDATKATGDVVSAHAANELQCRYGMVTDRARIVWAEESRTRKYDIVRQHQQERTADSANQGVLALETKYGGQRYKLSRAQIVMAHTQLGIGGRPTSGEGFEQVVADYALSALLEAMATDENQRSLLESTKLPQGWLPMSRLVSVFGSLGMAVAPVKQLQLRGAMAPDQTAWQDEVKTLFAAEKSLAASHLVVINGEKAAYGDLLIIVRHDDATKVSMLVVQCKRYLTTTLTVDNVVVELVKMGFGDAADHQSAFVADLPTKPAEAAKEKEWISQVKSRVAEARPLNLLPATFEQQVEATLRETHWRKKLKELLASAGGWPVPTKNSVREFWQRQLALRTLERAVVVCYGAPPQELPDDLQRKGLFLYAPRATDATPTADSPAPCLHELYPLTIERPVFGVVASAQITAA